MGSDKKFTFSATSKHLVELVPVSSKRLSNYVAQRLGIPYLYEGNIGTTQFHV